MKQTVSVNLTTRTAKDWTPPVLTYGESLSLALRFFKNHDGEEIEASIDVSSMKASIGREDARPAGGKFAIHIGTDPISPTTTTADLNFNSTAADVRKALDDVPAFAAHGTARVVWIDGSWLIFAGDQTESIPMTVVNNSLWPLSYGRVYAWQVDGKWVHELRLIQTPVAHTTSHEVVLPPAPVVTRIQEGGADPSNTYMWNEIQQLYVPPEFRGAYLLKRGYAKTTLLSREDDVDAIQEALQALGAGDFKVSLPLDNKPNIEFIGDYAGASQDLLEVQVKQAPAGDLSFTLALDRAAMSSLLRKESPVTLPLEIRIVGEDDSGFAGELVALSLPVTLKRPIAFPELEERPVIDWLRPTSPKKYVPYAANQVLTGNKYYAEVVGDGAATAFVVATGLTGELIDVFVRENVSGGRLLVNGTDYSVTIDSDNQVTVTALDGAPAAAAWLVVAASAQAIAQWAADLEVTVPQVVSGGGYPSLPDFMDDIGARITVLEGILPSTGPGASATQASGILIDLPKTKEVLFFKGTAEELKNAFGETGLDASKLGRPPMMLPAVHDSSVTNLTTLPLPAVAAGSVWSNGTGAAISLGRGIYGGTVATSGHFASDGRVLYAARRDGSSNSFYPVGFERELWRIFVNDKMLRLNRTLDVQFGLALQLALATSNAQWVLVVEKGTAPSQGTPSPTGTNLENVTWDSTPMLSQRLVLTGNRQTHTFGVRIKRSLVSLVDTLSLDTLLYGVWEGNNSAAPAGANFAVRARLINFDTENALEADARGFVVYELTGADPEAKESTPKAIIS